MKLFAAFLLALSSFAASSGSNTPIRSPSMSETSPRATSPDLSRFDQCSKEEDIASDEYALADAIYRFRKPVENAQILQEKSREIMKTQESKNLKLKEWSEKKEKTREACNELRRDYDERIDKIRSEKKENLKAKSDIQKQIADLTRSLAATEDEEARIITLEKSEHHNYEERHGELKNQLAEQKGKISHYTNQKQILREINKRHRENLQISTKEISEIQNAEIFLARSCPESEEAKLVQQETKELLADMLRKNES